MVAADWVAASVRARLLAERRAGAGLCRTIAAQPNLTDALALLAGSAYGPHLPEEETLGASQRAIGDTVLWELRVLAGWMPARGTPLARAAAAAFERDNLVALFRQLEGGHDAGDYFELGALASVWPRAQGATSVEELNGLLRQSPWGDPGQPATAGAAADVLTALWLRRLVGVAPGARDWAQQASVLLVARGLLIDGTAPTDRLSRLLWPLIGSEWSSASDLSALREGLSLSARQILDDVDSSEDLWRAEARLAGNVEAGGFQLLRGVASGPDIVLGALAVLAVDAWRTRAALGAAAAAAGIPEVFDVMA
ncbi:hypothetical protein BH11ACT4_BH11ACT4_18090 [soil metagenome]